MKKKISQIIISLSCFKGLVSSFFNLFICQSDILGLCLYSLHSQLSDSYRMERLHPAAGGGRGGGASGSSASLYGSLPRQAPPPVPLSKPTRDTGGLGALATPPPQASPTHNQSLSASPRLRQQDRDGSVRRGSFVERCQERAKGSEAATGPGFGVPPGSEGVRRSLAVCSELEARFGLRTTNTFSVSPGARYSLGAPSSLSPSPSSSLNRRATPTSPASPTPSPALSPTRSQAPPSPRHAAAGPPVDSPASPESPVGSTSPSSSSTPGPPTSPKPHMNETSF